MLKLADLRKTTRRTGNGELRVVHPRFLRDRTLAPRIELATAYLESMLGKRRRDLDQEVVVQLFGDHKLARCIVASLAESYRYRARTFAELLTPQQCAALAAEGIADPSALRLWLYRRVNASLSGFAGAEERVPFLRDAAAPFGIAPDLFEMLLTLDAPINAILARSGPRPSAADVIARFNFAVAAALLANASLVRLSLARIPRQPETVRRLCTLAGVRGELALRELVVHGQQDALNGWARHGTRLVRLLSALLACGLPARSAEALVANPNGEDWLFRLDAEVLGYLGAPANSTQPSADAEARDLDALLALWERSDVLANDFAVLRRAGQADDWTLRRASAPLVVEGTVLPAFFTLSRGMARIPLVLAPASESARARLAATAGRIPLVAVDAAEVAPLLDVPMLHYTAREDVAALPHLLARAAGEIERRAEEGKLAAALDEARRLGVVTEPRLATLLGCAEEEVALRLALPLARHTRQEPAMQYVEGFGLCRDDVLERARQAAADVAELRRDQPVGRAWVLRQLGRRLRQLTGASEGIECLIDYLGAA